MVNKGIFSVSQFAFVCLPQTSETERKRVNEKKPKAFFPVADWQKSKERNAKSILNVDMGSLV